MGIQLSARTWGARKRIGLTINDLVSAGPLMKSAKERTHVIVSSGPIAVRKMEGTVIRGMDVSSGEGLLIHNEAASSVFQSEDVQQEARTFVGWGEPRYERR